MGSSPRPASASRCCSPGGSRRRGDLSSSPSSASAAGVRELSRRRSGPLGWRGAWWWWRQRRAGAGPASRRHVATAIASGSPARRRGALPARLDHRFAGRSARSACGRRAAGPAGLPASVFQALPRLLERTGNRERGGSPLLHGAGGGNDLDSPSRRGARHPRRSVVLDRRLAERGHFPPSTCWAASPGSCRR